MRDLRAHFRPEFLNRIDDIVLFKPLSVSEISRIVELQISELRKRLADRQIVLELSDSARTFIAEAAYDPVYGARPLKRYIQRQLETKIGRAIISGENADGSLISVDLVDGALQLRIRAEGSGAKPVSPTMH
jgi:ATP-dependent Clp protease ATP-binding subunit ClpB